MAPVGGLHPQPARSGAQARRQPARERRADGDQPRTRCLHPAQRGRGHLGREGGRHRVEQPRRQGTVVRSVEQQGLSPPDLLSDAGRSEEPLIEREQTDMLDDKFEYLLRLGDTVLVLSQRLCEWVGKGPALEEDMALANTALDLIGQARMWLSYAGEVEGVGRTEDQLAYLRDAHQFRNLLIVERPNGGYADTLMRQYLFDSWHLLLLEQ